MHTDIKAEACIHRPTHVYNIVNYLLKDNFASALMLKFNAVTFRGTYRCQILLDQSRSR